MLVRIFLTLLVLNTSKPCEVYRDLSSYYNPDSLQCFADPRLESRKSVYQEEDEKNFAKEIKYLTYDVNKIEGFNLRCDVFIRITSMISYLNQKYSEWIN